MGALSWTLAQAAKSDDKADAWGWLATAAHIAAPLECHEFYSLYDMTATFITQKFSHNEYYYQRLFKEKAHIIIPGCKVITHKNNPRHIPDAWISMDGDEYPVEVKVGSFDKAAQAQLKRYINVYQTKCGVAVGRRYCGTIPSNIIFVPLDRLEDN